MLFDELPGRSAGAELVYCHLAGMHASLALGAVVIWPDEVPADVNTLMAADMRSV
jgi:hypothetical protein